MHIVSSGALRSAARGALVAAVAAAVVLTHAAPAAAYPDLGEQAFAIHPPNYCGVSNGGWSAGTYPATLLRADTYSRTSTGGLCQNPSPAATNVFAAYAKLEYWNGSFALCNAAPHASNAYGDFQVFSSAWVMACGHLPHRLRTEHRITYAGVPTNQTRYSGTYTP